MFESLTDRFESISRRLRGKGRLSEADVDEALREIRLALLQADVNLRVVRDFVTRVREQLIGADLSTSLTPGEQVVTVVYEQLRAILGGEALKITYAPRPPTVILLAGLQGAGKTTTAGKLAAWFRRNGRNPLLVGADLQRPAAVEQLRILGAEAGVPVFSEPTDPVAVAAKGLAEARRTGRDVLIVDTAGRLSIDAELMDEVRRVSEATEPHYTFLVIDAMTGQDAVATAEAFHKTLELDGVILTKVDGDARGGAALSVKEVVGRPIVFVSTGEKQADFDLFHPDRMADRILGRGDIKSLLEKAEAVIDQASAEATLARLQEGQFGFDDLLEQMQQIKKMGPLSGLVGMFPGLPKEARSAQIDDAALAPFEAIIHSMTPEERRNPSLLNGSRRSRIARGSGTSVADVNLLIERLKQMQAEMRRLSTLPGVGRRLAKASGRANRKSAKKKRRGR
jgi:signal recognition particle subunit SRP54